MTATITTTAPTDQLAHHEQLIRAHLDQGPAWLRPVREAALKRLLALGLPHRKLEEWRYSKPEAFTQTPFVLAPQGPTVTAEQVQRFAIADLNAHQFVFVNGRHAPEHAQLGALPDGVVVLPLSKALQSHREQIEPFLRAEGEASTAAFTHLNAALLEDGLFIHIPVGRVMAQPIRILNIAVGAGDVPLMTHPRNIITVAQGAQVRVVEQYVSLDEASYFTNAVTQINAERDAVVSHYMIEQESINAVQVATLLSDQQRDSDVNSHTMLFGGRTVRNNINPRINGEHCHCLVNGLYMGAGEQMLDNHMRVEHNAPHGDSRQFYKGVLNDHAHAVFSGRIYVAKGAQKTDAKQSNQNLLLSDTSGTVGKPQLEIYADDVKCTHGATTGQIDANAIFYLMARGVDRGTAEALMTYAFAAESLERMKLEPVRAMLSRELMRRMPQSDMLEEML